MPHPLSKPPATNQGDNPAENEVYGHPEKKENILPVNYLNLLSLEQAAQNRRP
jgi:hypothetical protein